jgi:hypothetical protein
MSSGSSDTREMLAVHDAFRTELGALPAMVTAVPDGDAEGAAVIGGHVLLMTAMLHAHHDGEDLLMWPILQERVPGRLALIEAMEGQHHRIASLIEGAQEQAGVWLGSASALDGVRLSATLAELGTLTTEHLRIEEDEVLPIVADTMSADELAAMAEHSRGGLSSEQLPIALGLILDDTTPERQQVLLGALPPEARSGFEQFGRPAYADYRARLNAAAQG